MALLRSKFAPPGVPAHAVERGRLLERIRKPFRRLVLLHAPGGYGKSILAAQVTAAEPKITAWLHMDADDGDPRRLCRYLSAAVAEVAPQILKTELSSLPDQTDFEIDHWIDDFLLFLEEMTQERVRLVLDNFETVVAEPGAKRFLERVLDPGIDRFQLLIGTRQAPDVRLSRMIAAHQAIALGAEDLAFDLEEYKAAASAHGIRADDEQLEEQWNRSQGWCVLLGLGGGATDRKSISPGSDYVEQEVLDRLPDSLRSFLVRSSVLEVIHLEGAVAIGLDPDETRSHMTEIAERGVPHLVVDEDRGIRMHPLVREFLLGELRRQESLVKEYASKAAHYYCRTGRYGSAVHLLANLGLYEELLELIEEHWLELDRRSMLMRVEDWVRLLPESFHSHPLYVSHVVGFCQISGHHQRLIDTMQAMRDQGVPIEDWEIYPRLWAAESRARTHLAQSPGYDALSTKWKELLPRADLRGKFAAAGMLTIDALYELRYKAALQHAEDAIAFTPEEHFQQKVNARNNLSVVLQEIGRTDEVLEINEMNISECRQMGEMFYLEVNLVGASWTQKEIGDFRSAMRSLEEAEQLAKISGSSRPQVIPHVDRTRGEVHWQLGRRKLGMEYLQRAYEGFWDSNRYEAIGTGVTIDHWKSLSGEKSDLVSEKDFEGQAPSEAKIRYCIRRGRQEANRGRVDEARKWLAEGREMSAEMPAWLSVNWLTEAWACSRAEKWSDAELALSTGLRLLDELKWSHYPLADPELTAWAVTESIATQTHTDCAERLVRGALYQELSQAIRERLNSKRTSNKEATRLVAAATEWRLRGLDEAVVHASGLDSNTAESYQAMASEAPLPTLEVRLFGEVEVVAEGRGVRFSRKASRTLLEMLLLEYPNAVHEERLMEIIWPDADPKSAKRSLQTAVNDLRRALDPFHRPMGDSFVLYGEEAYRLYLPPGSQVDFLDFMREVTAALGGSSSGSRKMLDTSELGEFLDLYRGELIADAPYAEHVVEWRERARTLYLDGIATWVVAVGSRETPDAIIRLEKGLQTDPYWSEGLKLLMECLRREGRVLAALRRYRTFEKKLEEELGAEPDAELRETYEALTGLRTAH